MPRFRSRTVTHGRNMAAARSLFRAAGVAGEGLGRTPIVDRGAIGHVGIGCALRGPG